MRRYPPAVIAVVALWAAAPVSAATFPVTNNGDSMAGSLRAAITAANGSSGSDTIDFSGLPANEGTIHLTSVPLPQIGRAGLTIDGTTFSGGRVVLDGSGLAGSGNNGFSFFGYVGGSDGGVLKGFQIGGFSGAGVVGEASGVKITGNLIGNDGTATAPNGVGVDLLGVQDTVGGTGAGTENVISGNTGAGVLLDGSFTSGNTIQGNVIGLNTAGSAALANGGGGVLLSGGANSNKIGTGPAGSAGGNVIAGNGVFGIRITGAQSSFNSVQGNLIGLNSGGTAVPNSIGIDIGSGASNNTIGGSGAADVVSGNTGDGIDVAADGTSVGGEIGTNLAGNQGIPNGGDGIAQTAGTNTQIGLNDIPNVSFNAGAGLHVTGGSARVLSGIFGHNGGSGILGAAGGHVSSIQSADVEGNGGYGVSTPAPVQISNPTFATNALGILQTVGGPAFTATQTLSADGGTLTIDVFGATPSSTILIEAGKNPACGGSFLEFPNNSKTATTDAGGHAVATLNVSPPITTGIETIATDSAQGSLLIPTCATPQAPKAELAVTKTVRDELTGRLLAEDAHVRVGQLLRYTAIVRNTSTGVAATHVSLFDSNINGTHGHLIHLPYGDEPQTGCQVRVLGTPDGPTKGLLCALRDLGPGASAVVSYTVTPQRTGVVVNFADAGTLSRDATGELTTDGFTAIATIKLRVGASSAPIVTLDPSVTVGAKGTGKIDAACERSICDVLLAISPRSPTGGKPRAGMSAARRSLGTVRGRLRGHKPGRLRLSLNHAGLKLLKRSKRLEVLLTGTVRSGRARAHVRIPQILLLHR